MSGSHDLTSSIHLDNASKKRAAILSVVVSIVLLSMKLAAYALTGSAAILSDALESIINVVASGFALFSIYVSSLPADEDHPYGHGKIEYFSAGFEGAMISLAGLLIVGTSIPKIIYPQRIENLGLGLILVVVASAVNLALGLYLLKRGRATGSLALEADGHHLLTDVWTSAGVILGLILVRLTGWVRLDPIAAAVIGVNILFTGWKLVRQSAGRLMGEADDKLLEEIVAEMKRLRRPGLIRPHQLRAQSYGSRTAIDFHIYMPRFWDLSHVHDVCDEIEHALQQRFGADAEAIVHVDPCRPDHCSHCDLVPCPVRSSPFSALDQWEKSGIKATGPHPLIGP